ncbi:hypothetical protein D9M72_322530 [compost metagenome]
MAFLCEATRPAGPRTGRPIPERKHRKHCDPTNFRTARQPAPHGGCRGGRCDRAGGRRQHAGRRGRRPGPCHCPDGRSCPPRPRSCRFLHAAHQDHHPARARPCQPVRVPRTHARAADEDRERQQRRGRLRRARQLGGAALGHLRRPEDPHRRARRRAGHDRALERTLLARQAGRAGQHRGDVQRHRAQAPRRRLAAGARALRLRRRHDAGVRAAGHQRRHHQRTRCRAGGAHVEPGHVVRQEPQG